MVSFVCVLVKFVGSSSSFWEYEDEFMILHFTQICFSDDSPWKTNGLSPVSKFRPLVLFLNHS